MNDFPRITLKTEDLNVSILYETSAAESKNILSDNENLEDLFELLNKKLELEISADPKKILQLATKGDERYIEKLPSKPLNQSSLDLVKVISKELDKAISEIDDYSSYQEVDEKVRKELIRNQQIDILASMLEITYNIIIAKVMDTASELGVSKIRLDDKTGLPRLTYKMASEFTKLDIKIDISN